MSFKNVFIAGLCKELWKGKKKMRWKGGQYFKTGKEPSKNSFSAPQMNAHALPEPYLATLTFPSSLVRCSENISQVQLLADIGTILLCQVFGWGRRGSRQWSERGSTKVWSLLQKRNSPPGWEHWVIYVPQSLPGGAGEKGTHLPMQEV